MTMAARSKIQSRRKGQSMLEFAILLPILVLLFQILIETESAVSSAIVNQKYARSTLNYLMFNHRQYMEFKFSRNRENGNYHRRYWVGVDDKINFNERKRFHQAARAASKDWPQSSSPRGRKCPVGISRHSRTAKCSYTCDEFYLPATYLC